MAVGCGDDGPAIGPTSSPHAVLAAARAALRAATTYHVSGMIDDGFTVDLRVSRTALVGRVTAQHVSWDVVQDGNRLWFRGRQMWAATISADRAATFGDSWVRVTSLNAGYGWAAHLAHLQEEMPAQIFRDKAGLRNVGIKQFAGHRVIELASSGDIYDVEASAPHRPLSWLEPDEIGEDGKPCGIVLDSFGKAVRVVDPVTTLTY